MEQQRSPALQHPSHPWINPDPATVVQETSDTKSDIEQMQPRRQCCNFKSFKNSSRYIQQTEAFDGGRAGFYYDGRSQSSYEDRFYNYHGQSDGMTGCGCNNTNCCFYRSSNSTDNESNLQQELLRHADHQRLIALTAPAAPQPVMGFLK
uniref:Uncharacterized protein n=1 Tax=Macrostomum lignano TaxID=282301 RepID=A0A1I8FJI0_9PLAT